jgi:hypothetical protein
MIVTSRTGARHEIPQFATIVTILLAAGALQKHRAG